MTKTKDDSDIAFWIGLFFGLLFGAIVSCAITAHVITGQERTRVCKLAGGTYDADSKFCVKGQTITYRFPRN